MKKNLLLVSAVVLLFVLLVVVKQRVPVAQDIPSEITVVTHSSLSDSSIQPLETFSGTSLLVSSRSVSVTSADGKAHSCSVNKETRFFTKSSGGTPQVGDIAVVTYDAAVSRVEAMVLSRNTNFDLFRALHTRTDLPLNVIVGTVITTKEGAVGLKTESDKVVDVSYDKGTGVVLDDWRIDEPISKNLRAEISCAGKESSTAKTVTLYK